MNTNQGTKGRLFKMYLKKYGYLVLLGVALLTLTITLLVVGAKGNEDPNPNNNNNTPVSSTIQTYLPVLGATVVKEYNGESLMYNSTLNQWEAHKSIDFSAAEGSDVYAYTNGTVSDIYSNYLKGTVVVIDHADGLQTVYSSLQEDVSVAVGDVVTGGTVIGKVGTTANAESDLGAHLNFQMLENDQKIDPSGYLSVIETK